MNTTTNLLADSGRRGERPARRMNKSKRFTDGIKSEIIEILQTSGPKTLPQIVDGIRHSAKNFLHTLESDRKLTDLITNLLRGNQNIFSRGKARNGRGAIWSLAPVKPKTPAPSAKPEPVTDPPKPEPEEKLAVEPKPELKVKSVVGETAVIEDMPQPEKSIARPVSIPEPALERTVEPTATPPALKAMPRPGAVERKKVVKLKLRPGRELRSRRKLMPSPKLNSRPRSTPKPEAVAIPLKPGSKPRHGSSWARLTARQAASEERRAQRRLAKERKEQAQRELLWKIMSQGQWIKGWSVPELLQKIPKWKRKGEKQIFSGQDDTVLKIIKKRLREEGSPNFTTVASSDSKNRFRAAYVNLRNPKMEDYDLIVAGILTKELGRSASLDEIERRVRYYAYIFGIDPMAIYENNLNISYGHMIEIIPPRKNARKVKEEEEQKILYRLKKRQ